MESDERIYALERRVEVRNSLIETFLFFSENAVWLCQNSTDKRGRKCSASIVETAYV